VGIDSVSRRWARLEPAADLASTGSKRCDVAREGANGGEVFRMSPTIRRHLEFSGMRVNREVR
jgi:hypothetical protein